MRIKEIKKIEDCFDGSTVYGYTFDEQWTRESIFRLECIGKVEYFSEFPRPFFRVRGENGLQIKGVEGETNCRAIFPKTRKEVLMKAFEENFAD